MRRRWSKRLFDVAVAGGSLVVLGPVMVVLAAAVRMTSRGPALHRAIRSGRDGEPFMLFKFRSMRVDAEVTGPGITAANDPRVTSIGKWIRRSKLDELPQLINVLKGEMSIVGPRPEDRRYVTTYTPTQREILRFQPGITSPASITFRDEERILANADDLESAYNEVLAKKIDIDLNYFANARLRDDVKLIVQTVHTLLRTSSVRDDGE